MLSSNAKRSLSKKLGPVVKFTFAGGFYWDSTTQKFIPLQSYNLLIWLSRHYFAQFCQLTVLAYLVSNFAWKTDIPEDGSDIPLRMTKSEALKNVVGLMIWFAMVCLVYLGLIQVENYKEMAQTLNQVLLLDNVLGKKLKNTAPASDAKNLEALINFIFIMSLLIPAAFCLSFFHPHDPMKDLAELLLDRKLPHDSMFTWIILLFEFWIAFCYTSVAANVIYILVFFIYFVQSWLHAITPVSEEMFSVKNSQCFCTIGAGKLAAQEITIACRSLQSLSLATNCWVGQFRMSFHFLTCLLVSVVSSFALIRTAGFIISEGNLSVFLTAALLLAFLVAIISIVYVECVVLDGLEEKWIGLKAGLLRCCKRKSLA